MSHFSDRDGATRRFSYLRCIQDGQEEQAEEGTESVVDVSKVGGCVEGMWNEDNRGVHFGLPADDRCVRGNLPDSQ